MDEEEAVGSWRPGGFWRSVGRYCCYGVLDASWDGGVPLRAYADLGGSCLDGGGQRWWNAGSSSLDAYFWSCSSSGRNGFWGFVVAGCNEERQTSSEIGCRSGRLWEVFFRDSVSVSRLDPEKKITIWVKSAIELKERKS